MRFKRRSPLRKKPQHGPQRFPMANVAWYGPDDQRATKVAVGIILEEDGEPRALKRWFANDGDLRQDRVVGADIQQFIRGHGVKSVVVTESILGCPHEEGVDYPEGETCPKCPFWAGRKLQPES